ncbi:membrane-bound aldehyde dehydrogenase, large subunit [Ameyamaea chiangmaiensis NBRC 103196]|uniref:Xanthine dehydrogenase family protein molybdopterin-binding subunit n=1 Tax=Ameyamaea chiangmaiensis TaxID=442969 RepID=A0A850PBA2_9PROT|nr:molybdopterin cofactor-binding domain-containing protein [Ameyamaea chiangmaiensis]MBS4074148.1 xanthine dehydrogenase family protein molybdopterin-binding subunit [Ameyamaea chiangmaiensis]NVN39959.1 xanthine dehydrogenase family protein molybdopterin-binding subunit [Ameyamaea chiangmaiensis]GBQ71039.1 membrane-bound aldehyde dehydrogenase, large subunit [Ameyamaea chiangmaiensis NBRC 103196]
MGKLERIAARQDGRALSRRGFLLTAGGAGFVFGFARPASAAQTYPSAVPGGLFEPTIWCAIGPDGTVNVNIIRAEMGQHVGTALARIIADEMEADWDKVKITQVDTDPKWGLMVTGGSWSVWMTWDVFRQAGAAARTVMIEEGAKLLGTTPAACSARNGMVTGNGRSISYGDIVARGRPTRQFTPDDMAKLPLKPATERRLIGKPVAALDIPAKTTGQAIYGIDVKIDGMVYARPKMPPTRYGTKVLSVDETEARTIPGYQRHVVLDDPSGIVPGWVVVIASTYPAAIRAADALKVEWSPGETHTVTEAEIIAHGHALIARPDGGTYVFDDKGTQDALHEASRVMERSYTCASVAHYQLEPVNAIARHIDGQWEIHTGNQWQSLVLPQLAKALAVPAEQIVMRTYLLGGGFGRRLNGDYAVPAALASKALGGVPVKLILTRSDDMAFDSIRSPSVQTIRAGLDPQGHVTGMRYDAVAGWPTEVMAPAFMQKGVDNKPYDQFAVAGADHWYQVGPMQLRAISNDLANRTFRPGWLRSVSAGWTPWALESFLDEVAHDLKKDPLAMRLSMLTAQGRNAGSAPDSNGGAKRQAAVLQRLADKIGWGRTTLPADTALGLATSFGQERGMPTWTAGAAQVHVDRKTGVVTCQKLWLVIDAGTIVDPGGALAQTEGAALWGLSMALFEGSEIVGGTIRDRNLDTYTPLRIPDVPDMDIEFADSTEKPMGLGEPGVTVIAPAIGNAVFNAVGARLRHLPIRPEAVLAALHDTTTA